MEKQCRFYAAVRVKKIAVLKGLSSEFSTPFLFMDTMVAIFGFFYRYNGYNCVQ
tara:strand:- start:526 stop:687 length:162 start_codon:yes stop_codon:yes gene_type:complete